MQNLLFRSESGKFGRFWACGSPPRDGGTPETQNPKPEIRSPYNLSNLLAYLTYALDSKPSTRQRNPTDLISQYISIEWF